MKIPDFLKSTYTMLHQAFPNGVDEESYWALLYLLYDYMADENLTLIMSAFVDRSWGVIANDIYKVHQIKCGFEEKNESTVLFAILIPNKDWLL